LSNTRTLSKNAAITIHLFVNEKLTTAQVAIKMGVSKFTIIARLKKVGALGNKGVVITQDN
jgi:hypothetical protein